MNTPEPSVGPKACFPGPKSENESWVRAEFQTILDDWFSWRRETRPLDPAALSRDERLSPEFLLERERMSQALADLMGQLRGETTTFSPRYAGHMVSDVSLPALFGHLTALLHNPNNTSREASRVGTAIEAEAITMLAGMLGFDPAKARGHFTSGGTVANFEAIWRARYRLDHWCALALWISERSGEPFNAFEAAHMGWTRFGELTAQYHPPHDELRRASAVAGNPADVFRRISLATGIDYSGPVVLVPGNKHFSWQKAANVFGLGEEAFWRIALDEHGRLNVEDLSRRLREAQSQDRPVLAVVTVAGTTETGEIDPVDKVCDLLDDLLSSRGWHVWHHVDAAYGGFFCTIPAGPHQDVLAANVQSALQAMGRVDSVTIDPHKLGYIPYACGAFLTRDTDRYAVSVFDAPYLERPHLSGDIWGATLEGSRAASGAAAMWMTGQTIGLQPDRMGAILAGTIRARQAFQAAVEAELSDIRFLEPAHTNIACFSVAAQGEPLSVANQRTLCLFEAVRRSGQVELSMTTLRRPDQSARIDAHVHRHGGVVDCDKLVLLRGVFMNPYWQSMPVSAALLPEFVAALKRGLQPDLD